MQEKSALPVISGLLNKYIMGGFPGKTGNSYGKLYYSHRWNQSDSGSLFGGGNDTCRPEACDENPQPMRRERHMRNVHHRRLVHRTIINWHILNRWI